MYQAVHSLDTHPARPQPGLGHALCALTHMAHAHTQPVHRFTYRWLVHTRLVHIHSLTVGSCTQAQGPGLPPLPATHTAPTHQGSIYKRSRISVAVHPESHAVRRCMVHSNNRVRSVGRSPATPAIRISLPRCAPAHQLLLLCLWVKNHLCHPTFT